MKDALAVINVRIQKINGAIDSAIDRICAIADDLEFAYSDNDFDRSSEEVKDLISKGILRCLRCSDEWINARVNEMNDLEANIKSFRVRSTLLKRRRNVILNSRKGDPRERAEAREHDKLMRNIRDHQ